MPFARFLAVLLLVCVSLLARPLAAQEAAGRDNEFGTGAGFEVILTNSGFGLGGYYKHAVSPASSLFAEVSFAPGKDEREFKFSNYFRSTIPNKANYLLIAPVQIGVQRRLFRNEIENNFRPFLQLGAGPSFGWEYPYFRDCNDDGRFDSNTPCESGGNEKSYDAITALPKGALRVGFGGSLFVGAHFGRSRRAVQSVRVGYTFSYFGRAIQLLEKDVQGSAQHYFGTPSVGLLFGRLF